MRSIAVRILVAVVCAATILAAGSPRGLGPTARPVWPATPALRAEAAPSGDLELRHVKTVFTWHGNAAHMAWSDDGKTLFLANEEGDMSAAKIDAGDPARLRIAATDHDANFLWAVDQRRGLLVFQASIGGQTLRLDPQSFHLVWRKKVGDSHAIATDGSRVYVPVEGAPGALAVIGADGNEIGRVAAPDAWPRVYGAVYAEDSRRLYVVVSGDRDQPAVGGIYIFGTGGSTPALLGRIAEPASGVAVAGTRLWTRVGDKIEAWNVVDPAHPSRLGSWQAPLEMEGSGRGRPLQLQVGSLAVNRTGTRLYATYSHRVAGARGGGEENAPAGFMIFDVTGSAPSPIARQDWAVDGSHWVMPTVVAVSPDGNTVAVSYWRFGVRLFRVAGDRITDLGTQGTTGEAHDVYVDSKGLLYVFANDDVQVIDPRTGAHVRDVPVFGIGDGGWKPFRDGNVVLRGSAPTVVALHDGMVEVKQTLARVPGYAWDNVFDDPYLYTGTQNGSLVVQKIDAAGDGRYTARVVGAASAPEVEGVPAGRGGPGRAFMAVAKQGHLVWALGPNMGLVAFDVSVPEAPHVVFQDPFRFGQNGGHVGLVAVRGRVYAGAGNAGIIIYDARTFKRTGSIGGLNVDFLDTIGDEFLVVANYWYPRLPEGVYVYDLRVNPDAPVLVDHFPKPNGNANFRVRAVGMRIYRLALYGVDILDLVRR